MTRFLDLRSSAVGGDLASSVAIARATTIGDYQSLDARALLADAQGRHVLIATHGFNVDRQSGIACLANWEGLLFLEPQSVFVGVLWPGDSVWAHGLDYPEEPLLANRAGQMLAAFLDANFGAAASLSFASHSLGARVILETISQMTLPVRGATLMAGAIDDDCLASEFKASASKIGTISVLASTKDAVLSSIFPIGNFFAGIIAEGHPWWRAALGHRGPSRPWPVPFQAPFQIPDDWDFGHGDYLRTDNGSQVLIPVPADVPPQGTPRPAHDARGWQEAWSAAFAHTRFR
jgi:hypothetical protein